MVLLYHIMNLVINPNHTLWYTITHPREWNHGKDSQVFDRSTYTYAKDKK